MNFGLVNRPRDRPCGKCFGSFRFKLRVRVDDKQYSKEISLVGREERKGSKEEKRGLCVVSSKDASFET